MKEFYKRKDKKNLTREAIIGLGEDSFRKNYYSELQEKILELEKVNIRNKALLRTIPDMLFVSDSRGYVTPFSFASEKPNPIIGDILRNKEITGLLREGINKAIKFKELITLDFILDKTIEKYYMEARISTSEIDEVLIMIRDITERVLMENRLRDMAEKDGLTGLYNRNYFEEKFKLYEKDSNNSKTLILLDIDGLKMVNDTLGHLTGDRLMVEVSKLLKNIFDGKGMVARVGGDEFAVLLEDLSREEIEDELKKLNKLLDDINLKENIFSISLSYGYAYSKSGEINTALFFQEADNNMHQNKMLKESSTKNNLVKTLMKALEAKDYITEGHADRMGTLATLIAKEMKLTQNQIDKIQLLTKFHDIGKVGIPDSILKKPGLLTDEEWEIMKTHSSIGERIANESNELKEISYFILTHQEKWDGSGYPVGLKGEEIPIESRILAIVDTFDAMTNDRPYRKALSFEDTVKEIEENSGSQFDPDVVKVFTKVFNEYILKGGI